MLTYANLTVYSGAFQQCCLIFMISTYCADFETACLPAATSSPGFPPHPAYMLSRLTLLQKYLELL